ncbi:MAG: hypothetical protein WCQ50_09870, partial [Spirochaetota bacterium]
MNMSALGRLMIGLVAAVGVLASCASAPTTPAEDPRVGTLQGQVDGLQGQVSGLSKQLAERDATLADLKAARAAM